MRKAQRICLILMILLCLNYTLSMLLGSHYLAQLIILTPQLEELIAFVIGACAFIDILAFRPEE